jgi:uncharacterized protein (DUF952 family)
VGRLIFHITPRSSWERARAAGRYEPPSFAADGFIHFSDVQQVVAVADARFAGAHDLVLLCVTVDRLDAPLRYESSGGSGEQFPHLYGALNLGAVVDVVSFVEEDDGFAVPPEVRDLGL